MKSTALRRPNQYADGFTLLEIMVVIIIIAILIGLLVPSLGRARDKAKEAATRAQMKEIVTACETYRGDFGAYPGFIDDVQYPISGFTSSQSLVVSLSRRFYGTDPAMLAPPETGTAFSSATINFWVSTDPSKLARNYDAGKSVGATYQAYLNVASKYLSDAHLNGMLATTGLDTAPCYVDTGGNWPSVLPILYYRQRYKYDPENRTGIGNYTNQAVAVWTANNAALALGVPTVRSCFYTDANQYLDQGKFTPSGLQNEIAQTIQGVQVPPGGFVLIAAGIDRTFGPDMNGHNDDIVVTGGN